KNRDFKFNAEIDSAVLNKIAINQEDTVITREDTLSQKGEKTEKIRAESKTNNRRKPDDIPNPVIKYSKDSNEKGLDYDAEDSIVYDIKNKEIYLYGNAVVVYDDITVNGGKKIFNYDTQEVQS